MGPRVLTGPGPLVDRVADAVNKHRFVNHLEADLHDGTEHVCAEQGWTVQREAVIATATRRGSRIDLVVTDGDETVGVEVKIGGSPAAVAAQLDRYTRATPPLDGLVLVTTRAAHRRLAGTIGSTPVRVAYTSFRSL